MAYKDFSPAQILTAGEVDTYLMRQTIMVFATTTARNAAITTPTEGMVTYQQDTELLSVYNGTAWVDGSPVMRFASSAARTTSLPAPVEGMVAYLQDTDELQIYNGSSWLTVVVTSDDEGFVTTGSVTAVNNGQDGGIVLRTWTGGSGFVSVATRDMATNEYMMLSDGTNTWLGSGTGGVTYVRYNANATGNQLAVSSTSANFAGTVSIGSDSVVSANTSSQLHVRSDNPGGKGGEISIVNYSNTTNSHAALNFGVDASSYGSNTGNAQVRATNVNGTNMATELGFYTWNGSGFGRRVWIDQYGLLRNDYNYQGSMRLSTNWNQSIATAITVSSTTPTTICSAALGTYGNPVQIVATGDLNPVGGATWFWLYLYRNETQIGNYVICESPASSQNNPWALCCIDNAPGGGITTWSVRAARGGANAGQFGETGNGQAPSISVVELMCGI